jgi:hypothetical protein
MYIYVPLLCKKFTCHHLADVIYSYTVTVHRVNITNLEILSSLYSCKSSIIVIGYSFSKEGRWGDVHDIVVTMDGLKA